MYATYVPLHVFGEYKTSFNFLQKNIDNFDLVMESDDGTFMPLGFQFAGLFKENKFQNQHYFSYRF